jgi:Cu-Zn family superoxide dismutase
VRTHSRPFGAAIAFLGVLLAACGGGGGDDDAGGTTQTTGSTLPTVTAEMVAADGSPVGRVTFVETGSRMTVEGTFNNLPPGFHGFHVHAAGKCERPAFTTAGGHMVVGEQSHPAHAGDQPVLLVLSDRTAEIRFTTDRYKMADLMAAEGRAVIVHAAADNYANIPTRYVRTPDAMTNATGDAGDRIACGLVGGGVPTQAATTTTAAATTSSTARGATTTSTRQGATTTVRAAGTLDCQTIAFTPNSEDAASSVKATGLSCAEAEAFVRVAGARTSSGGPAQLDVNGYRCARVRSVQEPIPQAFYECTNGTQKVTFVRT